MLDDAGYGIEVDMEIAPKKRGRKKKGQQIKKKNMPKVIDEEEDELIEQLINGEHVSLEDLDAAFNKISPKIDLTCDTAGMINRLRNSSSDLLPSAERDMLQFIIKWCSYMMNKDEYDKEEMDALDAVSELASHITLME